METDGNPEDANWTECDGVHYQLDSELLNYARFNYGLVVVVLPVIALVGVVGNGISVFVYTRKAMRSSVNSYLSVLAGCDLMISAASVFLFTLENLRHEDKIAQTIYIGSVQLVFPLASIAQTSSVYMTILATVDWFVALKVPRLHTRFSRVSVARWVSLVVGLVSLIYNFSHFLEIAVITCFDPVENRTRPDVAPTPLRTDPLYVRLYYLYGYSVVMSVGPLLLLSVLAALVAAEIQRQKRRRQFWHHLVAISLPFETEIPACDDPTTLIAVVLLFLGCNSLALAVNFLEMSVDLGPTLNYLVDLSNFLVIFNSAANFFLYLTCGPAFRTELRRSMAALLPHSSEVRLDTGASRVNSMPVQSFAPLADLDSICSDG